VLLLTDRVDEWMLSHLYEFEGKPLQSVAKGGVDLGQAAGRGREEAAAEATAEAFKPLLERLKTALKDRAKDVRTTTRLVDSPACIVVDEGDMSSHLARMLKQAGQAQRRSRCRSWRSIPNMRWSNGWRTTRASTTWRRCCSTRPCWPKAGSWRTRRPMCSASTACWWPT
jgi:HSP90 family molecular chaperone